MTPTIPIHAPQTLAEAGEIVRQAHQAGERVIASGSGSKRSWVAEPPAPCILLDMRGLNRVVDYSPEDMTITVEAGMTLGALQELLSQHHQRVTLDPPLMDRATVGGVLAANDSGPIRYAFGTARDIVIGMSMIEPDGGIIKSGGKVVKNVAGYDLHKLYLGSFGTLGPIATVTFKLRPVPEARGLVVLTPRGTTQAEEMIAALLTGQTRPTMIELLNPIMASSMKLLDRLTLIVGFEDNAESVAWQTAEIVRALGGVPLGKTDSQRVYENLREAAGGAAMASFKATMLSSAVADFLEKADHLPAHIIARAGNGVVYGLLNEVIDDADWSELAEHAAAASGSLHIRGKLPAGMTRWSPPRDDEALCAAIRHAFDPRGTFAPERLH